MTDKKRFAVGIYLPDYCRCTDKMLVLDIPCCGDGVTPTIVSMTLSTPSLADARRFAHSRFPEALKINVREL